MQLRKWWNSEMILIYAETSVSSRMTPPQLTTTKFLELRVSHRTWCIHYSWLSYLSNTSPVSFRLISSLFLKGNDNVCFEEHIRSCHPIGGLHTTYTIKVHMHDMVLETLLLTSLPVLHLSYHSESSSQSSLGFYMIKAV